MGKHGKIEKFKVQNSGKHFTPKLKEITKEVYNDFFLNFP